MALKLIGAGFGRNGTKTLKDALEQIGYGPCYHMFEVGARPDHVKAWHDAAKGNLPDWDQIFEGFVATVDWPACNFWRQLMAHYPDAKVILSVRDPDAWAASMDKTIFDTWRHPVAPDHPSFELRKMTRALIMDGTFGGNIEDKDHVLEVYRAHNEAVKREVPSDNLLVYRVSDGWVPLCEFLGAPVPDVEFPHTNTTAAFRAKAIEKG